MAMTLEQQRAIALAEAQMRAANPVTVDPETNQPAGVPEYVPPGVSGYDPQTGEVAQYSPAGSAAMGAADATTLGWGDELASYLGSTLTGVPRDQVLSEMRSDAEAAQSENPGSYLAGQVGGGLAQAAATGGGGFGASAAKTGAGLGKLALGSAADGALYGGAYGSGSADDSGRLRGGVIGAGVGGAIGAAVPVVAAGITKALQTLRSPVATGPERTEAIRILQQEGVPLTAGQKTGNNTLRYAESELGGSKAAALMDEQAEKFTDAAMRKAGGSGLATPDNMAKLQAQFGQRFEDISARNTLRVDQGIVADMNKAAQDYARVLPTEQKQIFQNLGDDIAERFKTGGGTMSGKDYQTIRSRLTRMANNYRNSDGEFSSAIRGLRDALDNGMERSINPADAGAWDVLRRQYGNYKTLTKAAGGGGEKAGMGVISPAQLRMAASSGNKEGFVTGASDFTDLAKAGQAVMTPLPNSGTAARTSVRNLGSGILAGGGALAGGVPGMAAGLLAPQLAGRALMSAPVQRYLSQEAATQIANPVRDALIAAYLRQGAIPAISGR